MTKEELGKEAEEYLTQFYCLKQCYDIAIRECKNGERIRCNCFEVRLNCLTSFAEQVTKELRKENAELKEAINHFNPCGDWNDDVHDCEFRHYAIEYGSKLAKAKMCLEQLVSEITVGELEVDPNVLQQAENFLKEE